MSNNITEDNLLQKIYALSEQRYELTVKRDRLIPINEFPDFINFATSTRFLETLLSLWEKGFISIYGNLSDLRSNVRSKQINAITSIKITEEGVRYIENLRR